MVIVFYDAIKELIYIATEKEKMQIISSADADLLSHIPNDDILYVQNAEYITKNQFSDWLAGNNLDPEQVAKPVIDIPSGYENSKWLHAAHNGTIIIDDIKTKQYPNGVTMHGKYEFIPLDSIGGFNTLEESLHCKILLAKGKIEVVGYDYVKKHIGKKKSMSARESALDSILVKDDRRGAAESAARKGLLDAGNDIAAEILIEGDIT